MPTYRRSTRIPAPIEDVWAFHATIDGLETLTPNWMQLRIESVTGPNGERNPDTLKTGSRINMSIRPFGIGPRHQWVSRIVARMPNGPIRNSDDPTSTSVTPSEETIDSSSSDHPSRTAPRWTETPAYFVDEMRDGPFRRWEHTHAFYADADATQLVDVVDYQLPYGGIGDVFGPFAKVGFEGMFRDRHHRTINHFRTHPR